MRFIFLFSFLLLAMTVSGGAACLCHADYSPVCATNGFTYGNMCSMNCEGASFRHYGECKIGS